MTGDSSAASGTAERYAVWRNLVGLASGLSVIVGVLISLTQLAEWVQDSKRSNVAARLGTYGHVRQFLQADEDVRRRSRDFVKNKLPNLLPAARAEELIARAGSGEDFYLSDDMKDFAAVHYHYEQLGALVKLQYIDFALVYEIIAFPDDYVEKVAPLRRAVAANWVRMGQGLKDFGSNFDYLQSCYAHSRNAPKGQAPSCPAS